MLAIITCPAGDFLVEQVVLGLDWLLNSSNSR